jgi:hypothetical protein
MIAWAGAEYLLAAPASADAGQDRVVGAAFPGSDRFLAAGEVLKVVSGKEKVKYIPKWPLGVDVSDAVRGADINLSKRAMTAGQRAIHDRVNQVIHECHLGSASR